MTNPKIVRKKILQYLYDNRSRNWIDTPDLINAIGESEEVLDTEIKYLKGKYLLEIVGSVMSGKLFMSFIGVKITSNGIDTVEDPDEFQRLFSINISTIGNVTNSNVSIGSQHINQNLHTDELDADLSHKIDELKQALEEKNQSKVITILKYIGDKSIDLFISIIASGLLQK